MNYENIDQDKCVLGKNKTLRELLNEYEFDYVIRIDEDQDKVLKLIDLTGANLGDIESDIFIIDNNLQYRLFDRLENYIFDYEVDNAKEQLGYYTNLSEQEIDMLCTNIKELNKAITECPEIKNKYNFSYILGDKQADLIELFNELDERPFVSIYTENELEEPDDYLEVGLYDDLELSDVSIEEEYEDDLSL